MTDGLVIRLLRVASYMNDIGENGYEVETVKEAAVRIDAMLASLHEISVRCEQLEAALLSYYRYVCPTCGGRCCVVQSCPENLARAALGEKKDEQL